MPDKCDTPWRVRYYDDYLDGHQNHTYICAPDEKEAAVKFCNQDRKHKVYVALMVEGNGEKFLVWVQETITARCGLSSERKPNARL